MLKLHLVTEKQLDPFHLYTGEINEHDELHGYGKSIQTIVLE